MRRGMKKAGVHPGQISNPQPQEGGSMNESIAGEGRDLTTEIAHENIPEELRRRQQWVNQGEGKIPHTPGTRRRADSTDSETWRSFEEAVEDGRGLGFVFTSGDPYTGIDLDKCRDPKTGAVEEWAQEIIEALDGYTEISPSGTGIHVIVRGKLPAGNNRRGHIEAYSLERYFTMTGAGEGGKIPNRQAELERFHRGYLGMEKPAQKVARPTRRRQITRSLTSCWRKTPARGGDCSPVISETMRVTAMPISRSSQNSTTTPRTRIR